MELARFSRQMAFIGKDAQLRLSTSTVGIIGTGGLGTVVAQLLCRMGVGKLVLVDGDVVLAHNLPRQVLFEEDDIGQAKVDAAAHHLARIASSCRVTTARIHVNKLDDLDSCLGVDLLVDCTDNHKTRRLIDAFCAEHRLPWVHGASIRDKGLVCFFDLVQGPITSYDDLYHAKDEVEQCDVSGVMATTTHLVASLQAQLAVDFLTCRRVPDKCFRIDASRVCIESFSLR